MLDDEAEAALREELEELRSAIRKHRDQKADDRCWMDDQELYAVLGDGNLGDNRVGDQAAMLENCKVFLEKRCTGGGWVTYAMMEEELRKLKGRAYATHASCGAILETSVDDINNKVIVICPSCPPSFWDQTVLDEQVDGAEDGFYLVRKP